VINVAPRDDAGLRAKLIKALHHAGDTHSLADLGHAIQQKQAQWWCNGDGAIVTEILHQPQFDILNYWLVAGALGPVLAMQQEIDAWGRAQGCRIALATGRAAWRHVLDRYGWTARAVQFVKPLVGDAP